MAKGTIKPIYISGRFDTLFLVSLGQTISIESVFLPSAKIILSTLKEIDKAVVYVLY